jgi:hypothetical protein
VDDGSLTALWIEGDGGRTIERLVASHFDGDWLEPVLLAEIEYDFMLAPFDAGAAANGDVVVLYLAADGLRARRFTGGEWQAPILVTSRGAEQLAYFDVTGGDGSTVYVSWGEYDESSSRLYVACLPGE